MSTTIKFKSIWYSFFQAQNSMLIQKSIKHVDKFDDNKTKGDSTVASSATTSRAVSTSSDSPANDDYRLKREKNNESVRKSRAKSRMKLQECAGRVQELRVENTELNTKLNNLQTELFTLRGLFQTCFSLNNKSQQVKPNEIPTSTLYKLVMQNQHKLGLAAPQTASASVAAAATPMLETTPQILPITDGTTNTQTPQVPPQLQLQQPSSPAKPSVDEFYINELKNALINCVSYPDSPVTPTSIMDQQIQQLEQQLAESNQMMNITDLQSTNPDDMIQTLFNEFEVEATSSSPYSSNNDPFLSSPSTTDSDLVQENLAMMDHDYTYRRAEFMN